MNATDTPLPAFLEQQPDGHLQMVIHATQAQEYDLCVEKFNLHTVEQIEAALPKPALNYGGAVHEALAFRYENMDLTTSKLSLEACETEQAQLLESWFDEKPQPPDEWRNAGRAVDLIRAYNAHYPTHDWQVLAVEEEFEVRVGNVELGSITLGKLEPASGVVPVLLRGRKDLVVAWHDGIWVVDHKTAQDFGKGDSNSALDEGRMSFQFRAYAWAERETQNQRRNHLAKQACDGGGMAGQFFGVRELLPVLGTVGNYLISRKPYATEAGARKSTLPRNQFHQEAYPYTAADLAEWQMECLAKCEEILGHWQRRDWALHRKRGACGHWGRCEFFEYCAATPGEREAILQTSDFQRRTAEREL